MLNARKSHRMMQAVFVGAAAGAALLGASPLAEAAQEPGANPPNCSAADLEGVRSGVDASTSAYLFSHADLNDFMSGMQGLRESRLPNT